MWKLDEDEEDDLDSPNIHKELKKKTSHWVGWHLEEESFINQTII